MRKMFFIALLLLSAMTVMAENADKLHVKCHINNLGDTIFVVDGRLQTPFVGKAGVFEFDLPLSEVKQVVLASPDAIRGTGRDYLYFTAVPGESAEISGEMLSGSITYKGSKFYQDYSVISNAVSAAQKPRIDFLNDLIAKQNAGADTDSLNKVYNDAASQIFKAQDESLLKIIEDNPENEATAVIISQLTPDAIEKGYEKLSANVKNGRMKDYAYAPVKKTLEDKKIQAEVEKKQASGVEAPDFTLNDINGKPLTLSSLRGKYVLLDFWGSWCYWCIKGMPQMKEYYNKYKGKYEVLGIDCNDPVDKWKAAVKEHDLPWLHVYNERTNGKVLEAYGIQGFPTKILIGPDGKIIKTVVGEDPAFYTFMDELFGEKK